jgi:hypothetical protein
MAVVMDVNSSFGGVWSVWTRGFAVHDDHQRGMVVSVMGEVEGFGCFIEIF